METFSALLTLCAGNSPVSGEFPAQRPVTRNFDVFFDLRLFKRLSIQSRGWWFETLSGPLWRHYNVTVRRNGMDTLSALLMLCDVPFIKAKQYRRLCFYGVSDRFANFDWTDLCIFWSYERFRKTYYDIFLDTVNKICANVLQIVFKH